ncbi:MAG: hypothetical protein NC906_08980, partial [Candidatus Omnitrophica bacterium]|nr:hypothetical protein [Candidatus Omnitrophota bacterium]
LPGFLILSVSNGADKTKIWDTTTKNNQIITKTYKITDELKSETYVWVEGYAKSNFKGCELQIFYAAPDETTAVDTVVGTVAKYNLMVYYHNDSCDGESEVIDFAYPFTGDNISIRAILMTQSEDLTGYWCGVGYDPLSSGQYFANDGYWYSTGTQGSEIPSGNWNSYNWPRLPSQAVIKQWKGLPLDFTWYEINSAVDKETVLSSVHKDTYNGNIRRFFYYPGYTTMPYTGWGFSTTFQEGTHRIIVRAKRADDLNTMHFIGSLQPTPGNWEQKSTDHIHPDFTKTWSQNCDEPPDTIGPTEYAVCISVRKLDEATWPETPIMKRYLQWLTSFLEVPYEWGGHWYGGRADENGDVTYVDNGYDGYGTDCSGLVSAAARWAGYNWSPWRQTTSTLNGVSSEITDPDTNLRPGDILNKAGFHVVTVYQYTPGHINEPDSEVIESVGGDVDRVWIRTDVNIYDYYARPSQGYKPRRLVQH